MFRLSRREQRLDPYIITGNTSLHDHGKMSRCRNYHREVEAELYRLSTSGKRIRP